MIVSRLLVQLYFLLHGRLNMRGAGWLIKRCTPLLPSLRDYPQKTPWAGTARLDFRDAAAFDVLNVIMGDYGPNAHLYPLMDRYLGPNKVLWDVGANLGYLALYFTRPPHDLKAIHVFEPNPAALKTLGSLFDEHRTVRVHPVALGREDAVLELCSKPDATPYGSFVRKLEHAEKVPVPVRRGDAYCRSSGIEPPDVIKIDVEGFEPDVFAGLRETIAEHRPTVFFEHCWLSDEQLEEILSCMPEGYRPRYISKSGAVSDDPSARKLSDDAVLVPE
jgi:FkbM family methyltransferase